MKKTVWKNKSNGQLCITIPHGSGIKEGDTVELKKGAIKRITYSGVVGDLFHYGHLHSIQFAQSISDYNICGVLTDKAVEQYRSKPIANLKERKAVISSLNCVDRVIIQNQRDPTENLKKIHEEFPNAEIILVHGSDLHYVHGSEYTKKIGGKVIKHPYYEKLSTFKIIQKITESKGKIKDIADFAYLIEGKEEIDSEYKHGNKAIVSTKANTLKALGPLLTKSRVEKVFDFTVSDWKNKKEDILKQVQEEFVPGKIIVRSSAINEDTLDKSMAGCYESVLNIESTNPKQIEEAIKRVINSYKRKKSESSFNQVLIQPHTENIRMSGVVFTRTLESNAPYYVINYDDSTGETDTVTKGVENKTLKLSRFIESKDVPKKMQSLLEAVKEIESLIPNISLDIEFGIDKKGQVYTFQTRPLTTSRDEIDDNEIKNKIISAKNQLKKLSKRQSHLAGDKTIFADMPDWNPAEIIGDSPNHLDYSLYDYIITESAWHEARTSQLYYNVNPARLVVLFGSKPYIDVRNSFNSFVPSSLSQQLREKLVSFYLNKLEKNPELQDKVEFEVLYTCYDLCFDERSKELLEAGFSEKEVDELRKALRHLTNSLVLDSKESIPEDLSSLKEIEKNRISIIKDKRAKKVADLIKDAKFLLDDCRRKGTVEFSRLARLGFIGKILLKGIVKRGIIDHKLYDSFMNSISTVATEIKNDFNSLSSTKLSKEEFIKKYYHLRPGSYDITSLRYDANPDLLEAIHIEVPEEQETKFTIDKKIEERITETLKQEGLKFNAQELLNFVKAALESREFSKFEFTKNLSDAIELLAMAGEKMGFTRQELSMLDIKEVFANITQDREELTRKWKDMISSRINEREIHNKIVLPPILFSEKDFDVVSYYKPKPNYITQKKVQGELVRLDNPEDIPDIKGKVVLIENGDPGYDWIFTRNPAGLITKYGGVASHMSIRCAEFGIPAAIGSGLLYDDLSNSNSVILDCGFGKITPIRGN